jgi:hypothetical protein
MMVDRRQGSHPFQTPSAYEARLKFLLEVYGPDFVEWTRTVSVTIKWRSLAGRRRGLTMPRTSRASLNLSTSAVHRSNTVAMMVFFGRSIERDPYSGREVVWIVTSVKLGSGRREKVIWWTVG